MKQQHTTSHLLLINNIYQPIKVLKFYSLDENNTKENRICITLFKGIVIFYNMDNIMKQGSQESNAFSKPPVLTQIVAYLVVVAQFLVYTTCMFSNFTNIPTRNGLVIVFYLTFAVAVVFWFLTSKTNVSDSLVKASNKVFDRSTAQSSLLYCDKCQCLVKQNSIHCRKCGICVQGFDHHCIWINHCIGQRNYKLFVFMVSSIDLNFIFYLITVIQLWKENKFGNYEAQMIAVWCLSPFIVVFSFLLTGLLIFHLYLYCNKTTTFLYWTNKETAATAQKHISNQPPPKVDIKIQNQEHVAQKRQQVLFELNKRMEISQSIHNLKIQKSRSNLTQVSKQKVTDPKKAAEKV